MSSTDSGWMGLSKRRVEVLMREGRMLEGDIHIPDGQSMTAYLAAKKYFVNLTDVTDTRGMTAGENIPHLAIRCNQIIWVRTVNMDVPISTAAAPNSSNRTVRLFLVGENTLTVQIRIAKEQRLTDYFDSNHAFIPFYHAELQGSDRRLPEVAVNHEAILALRELTDTDPGISRRRGND